MPSVLQPGQTSTKDDTFPAGLFGYQDTDVDGGGFFLDLFELEYRLLNPSGVEVQTWTSVDVDRASGTTDAVLSVPQGLYAPDISIAGGNTDYGTWTIEWRFRVESASSPQLTSQTAFRLIEAAHPVVDSPVQVQDLYDEGVPSATYSAARVARAIKLATDLFEEWTGRHYGPRLLTMDTDGEGGPLKQLEMPIIALAGVQFTFTTFSPADLPIEEGDLRVYNRHIRSRLLQPDDRDDPRVEFLRIENYRYPRETLLGDTDLLSTAIGFPLSQQNIKFHGLFGYTDWDGSAFGVVPELVREAIMRIALRKIQPLWQATGGGTSFGVSGPIKSEKTFDQQVTFSDAGAQTGSGAYVGYWTGDPAIDQIISTYRRPPALRSTSP